MRAGVLILISCLLVAMPASAGDDVQVRETVELDDILNNIARREGLDFAVTAHAPVRVAIGQLDVDDISYATLHTVLFNNGLAAVTVEGMVNIVPVGTIRQQPLPTLTEADDTIADDQWVTWTYRVQRGRATMFVPIVRPILPQQGHLVAHPQSGTIVVVDRYANAKRVIDLIRDMDENSTEIVDE